MSDLHSGEVPPEYKEPVFPTDIGNGGDVEFDIVRGGADGGGQGDYDLDTPIVASRGQRSGYGFPNGKETPEPPAPAPAETAPLAEPASAEPERVEYGHSDDFDQVSADVAAQADHEPEREDWAAPVPVIPEGVKEAAGRMVENVTQGAEDVFEEDTDLPTRPFAPGDAVEVTISGPNGTEAAQAPEQKVDIVYPPQQSPEADADVIIGTDDPAGPAEAEVTAEPEIAETPAVPAGAVTDQDPPRDRADEGVPGTAEPVGSPPPETPAEQISEPEAPEAVAPGPGPVETEPEIDAVPIETSEPAQAEAEPVAPLPGDEGEEGTADFGDAEPVSAEPVTADEIEHAAEAVATEAPDTSEADAVRQAEEELAEQMTDDLIQAAVDRAKVAALANEAQDRREKEGIPEIIDDDADVIDPEVVGDQLRRDEEPIDAEIVDDDVPAAGQEVVPSETETVEGEQLQPDGTWASEDGTHEGMTQEEWDAEMAALKEEAERFAEEMKAAYDAERATQEAERLRERTERMRAEAERMQEAQEAYAQFEEYLEKLLQEMHERDKNEPDPLAPEAAAEQGTPHYEDPLQQPAAQEAQEVPPPPQEVPQPPAKAETPPDVPSPPDDTPQQPEPKTDTPPPVGERGYPEGDLRNNIPPPPSNAEKFANSFGYYGKKGVKTVGALVGSTIVSAIFSLFQNMEVVGTPTPSAEGGFDVTIRRGGQTSRVNVKANSAEDAKAQFKRGTGNFGARFRAAFRVN